MMRIPIRKITSRFKICVGISGIFFVAENIICQSKCGNVALNLFRHFENALIAIFCIFDGLFSGFVSFSTDNIIRFATKIFEKSIRHRTITDV